MVEHEQEKKMEDVKEETPLCIHCLQPYSANDHFCKNCGEMVGLYTAWMPFERIFVFTNSIRNCWHKLFYEKEISFGLKLLIGVYLIIMAPFALIGLPFTLWNKYKKK